MDNFTHNARSIPMVQCMELQIRKQINFPNESVLQQVSDWRHCDNYISTVCRALYIVSAKNPAHYAPLAFGMAHHYSNCRINYSG